MERRRDFSVLLIIYLTLAFNFYNYSVKTVDYKMLLLMMDFLLLGYYLLASRTRILQVKSIFKLLLPLLFIEPYLSGFNKISTSGTHFLSIPTIVLSFGFLGFYLYKYKRVSEKRIINTFMVVGIFLFTIQIYQQMFPQNALFGIYSEEESLLHNYEVSDIRNGLFRYGLAANCVILVCMYYSWGKILEKFSVKRVFVFLVFFCSMYLTLTRQIVFASLASMACSFVIVMKKNNKRRGLWVVGMLMVFVVTVGINFQSMFGEFVERTESDLTTDNIRYASFVYYGEKIFTNLSTFLIGNGHASIESAKELNLDPTDIGFVGQAYYYGVLWILLWLYTIYQVLVKYKDYAPLYVKLYAIGTTIQSIGIFPYRTAGEALVWVTMLYIVDLNYFRNRQIYKMP